MEHFRPKDPYYGFEDVSFIFDTDSKVSLELKLPQYHEHEIKHHPLSSPSPTPQPSLDGHHPNNRNNNRNNNNNTKTPIQYPRDHGLLANSRPIWLPLTAWILSALFTILYCAFIHRVLIIGDPRVGGCVFDASLTNLLLSLFSQGYAMVLYLMVQGLLDALRWSLASRVRKGAAGRRGRGGRGGGGGISASNFFQLSPATDWLSVFKLMFDSGFRRCWGALRLALPFMGLGFGSILKFQNTFEYHFIPEGPILEVYAGTTPPDVSVLDNIPPAYMAGFFDTWSQQLTTYPRYAIPWPMEGCDDNDEKCTAIFLPGGLEIARKVRPLMNETILQGGYFNESEAISIERAPGMAVKYEELGEDFVFDVEEECTAYTSPPPVSDGLQICVRQMGDSIAAGWRACPSLLNFAGLCYQTDLWADTDPPTKTLMSAYRQRATTMYDRSDLFIRHVDPTSPATTQHLSAKEAARIWDGIFLTGPDDDRLDGESVNVTIHRLAWKYRMYTEWFPDHDAPAEQLRNFLSVPMQFAVSALQYANYTLAVTSPGERKEFPPELLTTAVGGRSVEKFVSPPWTAWTFIIAAALVMFLSGFGFGWVLWQAAPVPRPSGIVEVDFAAKMADVRTCDCSNGYVGVNAGEGDGDGDEDGDGDGDGDTVASDCEGGGGVDKEKNKNKRKREGGRFGGLVDELRADGTYTAWSIVKAVRGKRFELYPDSGDGGEDRDDFEGRYYFPVLRMREEEDGCRRRRRGGGWFMGWW